MQAACYGHADVGCLHIRPILNVKTREGVEQLRTIAREVSDLVVEFGGAMSGEHGDGLARSLWNAKLFGPEVYGCFEAVKQAFDPDNLLNPGKVVAAPDPGDNLRIGPDYHPREPDATVLDFSDQGGFARAVEMCSGVGACRKTATGTMCPSYMVTRDEEHTHPRPRQRPAAGDVGRAARRRAGRTRRSTRRSTSASSARRARASARPTSTWPSSRPSCCTSTTRAARVPLGVAPDGAHPPAQPARRGDRPAGQLDAPAAGCSSGCWRRSPGSTGGGACRRFDARPPPQLVPRATGPTRAPGRRATVLLLDDCFTTYNTPEVGRAAVRVLEAAGYRVELAGLACCGRPAISQGPAHARPRPGPRERPRAGPAAPARARRSSAASRAAC